MEEFFAWIGDVDVYDPPVEPSMNFGEGHDFRARLDLLDALVRRGLFLAVDGRREEGACLVEKAWRLYGGRSGGMRATWRTAATYQIACLEALEPLVLNASLSIQELEVAWAMLERMARANPWSGPEELLRAMDPEFSGAFPKAQYLASLSDTDGRPSWIADAQAHDARLQIIREGLRVRHYQIVHGEWPSIGPDGAILGLELATEHAPILDPCADPPRPLRAELIDGGFRIKSFGPDEVDDGGAKNLGSARTDNLLGDVFIDLSESPLYDFPSDAGHAYADKAEFLRRYPEGFPRQAFSTYERAPARHENGSPMMELHYDRAADRLMVWSPDTLGRIRRWAGSKGLFSSGGPGTLYDPRAGFGSRGDYAMQLNILDPSDF